MPRVDVSLKQQILTSPVQHRSGKSDDQLAAAAHQIPGHV
jgi:hypothetical protein